MRIGIDVSQLAYQNTGVAIYLGNLVKSLVENDKNNEYILFFSSLRKNLPLSFSSKNVIVKKFKLPPTLLDFIWNRLHVLPIEKFIGPVDVFITSDWTEPPSKSRKATILYDLIVYKHPEETAKKIVETQKRKLQWVKKEADRILCISEATVRDAEQLLGIDKRKLEVIYPGL